MKVHCAVLAVDALHTAIENYEHQHGLLKEKKPTDKEKVIKRLKHVIDPRKGLDVIRTKLVKDVEVENGMVRVYVDMEEDEQYAGNVREEIIERLEPLWDVKKVEVIFK